jgi:ATP-dependent protease Clp ATPase subunit
MKKSGQLRCSFCGKNETEVLKLVAGQRGYICDECIAIASRIINDSDDDCQPTEIQPSVWRKLLSRIGRFRRDGALSVSG